MDMDRPVITLLTDFGLKDGYVAAMKGVILSIHPDVRLVDVSHLIPPQDIRPGAFVLSTVYRDFPKGTIHLAVVDPGVGTSRRAIALKSRDYTFIGPDNGLFSWIVQKETDCEARSLENGRYRRPVVSPTFHGRDIFAPAAAHLASGMPFEAVGPLCEPVIAHWISAERRGSEIHGEVIHIDHFGNCIANITEEQLIELSSSREVEVLIGGQVISTVRRTYGESAPGDILALIGSSGHLEIAVNQANAANLLDLTSGSPVVVSKGLNCPGL
ncbi:MAG: S-adenosyl-l-methionine hydroxide adenosyltransferase family protein [Acidobacteriota bacterium]